MDTEQLRRLLDEPEGETLEFKRGLPDQATLVATVAAFANTRGGTLILGFDERNSKAVGLDHPGVALAHVREWVSESITPPLTVITEAVDLSPGLTVGVVQIPEGDDKPYLAEGRAIEREGARIVAITPARLSNVILSQRRTEHQLARLVQTIAVQSATVEDLRQQLGWRRQLPLQVALVLAGAVVGAAIGYLLGLWNPL